MSAQDIHAARERFFTAQSGKPATEPQKLAVTAINDQVLALALAIDAYVAPGYNKDLALTHLEDVSMRANRGIFAPGPNA